ncbi:MAG TPA: hypothetical protein VIG51_01060 [Candidatus Baltobacteraceae bacterium]
MSDSWEAFSQALQEESESLDRLNAAALALTQSLVESEAATIVLADRELNAARQAHAGAAGKRRGMQARGFGTMTLQQVCQFAPRNLTGTFNQRLSELACGSISLGITITNNKALIMSGLERLMRVTAKLQASVSDRPGVYKRRGYVPPPSGSVLVSSKA